MAKSNSPKGEERLVILGNRNVSRGKFAAAAVHAALNLYGIDHGAVIVLMAKPDEIEDQCVIVVKDAGRTEVTPGTVTAGVRDYTGTPFSRLGKKAQERFNKLFAKRGK